MEGLRGSGPWFFVWECLETTSGSQCWGGCIIVQDFFLAKGGWVEDPLYGSFR